MFILEEHTNTYIVHNMALLSVANKIDRINHTPWYSWLNALFGGLGLISFLFCWKNNDRGKNGGANDDNGNDSDRL